MSNLTLSLFANALIFLLLIDVKFESVYEGRNVRTRLIWWLKTFVMDDVTFQSAKWMFDRFDLLNRLKLKPT